MLQILKYSIQKPKILVPMMLQHSKEHRKTCPAARQKVCPGKGGIVKESQLNTGINRGPVCPSLEVIRGGSKDDGGTGLRRVKEPGKCRLGFIPEEWFLFLKPMTGVSGPYILMIGVGNYLVSKEIYVMEHEYYLGISIFIMVYTVTTKFSSTIASALDQKVDAIANELEEGRQKELADHQKLIDDAKMAIWRAEGQKEFMEAKKENIAIQLEAEFRERQMMVHKSVQRRMEYQVKRHWIARRIKHKWMVQWILENVAKGITPEFKKHVMEVAIRDLTVLADKYQASQASAKK